jgi:hypothetical protein
MVTHGVRSVVPPLILKLTTETPPELPRKLIKKRSQQITQHGSWLQATLPSAHEPCHTGILDPARGRPHCKSSALQTEDLFLLTVPAEMQ